jgi:hypothetical protein
MEGNIVGEPFDEFVRDQIKIRQSNQFGGYGTTLRTNDQLQYLNNRNAWVKLASSVDVLEGDMLVPIPPASSGFQGGSSPLPGQPGFSGNVGAGSTAPLSGPIPGLSNLQLKTYKSDKLRQIGIPDPQNYAGNQFASKAVLFNTLSSFDPVKKSYSYREGVINDKLNPQGKVNLWNNFAYGLGGTDFGIQPPPGIISATVDSINRGSIRKATVTLKAHNRFQFDVIELLYLRLGFTMMLEWGWDRYLDNDTGKIEQVENTIIEDIWFTSKNISQLEMLEKIQEKRREYDGNYDGFFGKVSNFTWSFNPDGSYDISIDLITLGDVIESIKSNTFAKGKFTSTLTTEDQLEQAAEKVSLSPDNIILKAAATSAIGEYLYGRIKELNANSTLQASATDVRSRIGSKIGDDVVNYCEIVPRAVNNGAKNQYYIRLGEFLAQLEGLVIPRVKNGVSTTPQINISYTTENNLISFFPNQISLDPKVCIFKPFFGYGDIKYIISPFYLNVLETYVNTIDFNGVPQTYGYLMNMYINIEYIARLVISNSSPSQDLPLLKLLQDLCNGINDALGGVNKIEPVIKNDNIITLIDQTLFSPEEDTVNLEVYGYNPSNLDNNGKPSPVSNFVKNIEFVSKITPQLASMISIGATAAGSNTSEIDGTAFSKWSEGLVDRFSQEIIESKLEDPQTTPNADRVALENEWRDKFKTVNPINRFFRNLFGQNVTANQKIVNNPRYGAINGQPMSLEKFILVAGYILRKNKENNIWVGDDLSTLVSTNYAAYLVEAFGGTVNEIKIYSTATKKTAPFSKPLKDGRYSQFNDIFIDQGKGAYKNYLNALNGERYKIDKTPSSEIGFIPLSFEVILEGISGIKIYNKLNVNTEFLPSNYPIALNFVITKVNHNISNNNWDTSLSTISMPNTKPYLLSRFASSGDSSGEVGDGSTGDSIPQGVENFDPGNLFTFNQTTTNAWKLKSDPTIPVENGFLHRYPGMLIEADTNLYKRLNMQNSTDSKKLRLFYPVMPHFINLVNAYEKAVSENGETFLQRYGKLTINSAYRSIPNTPVGSTSASPGTSRHGLGLAVDLQQPASHEEVHTWFKTNAPGLGWMRIPILSSGTNETWHWEFQYEGPYAKINKNAYATASNIQNNGRNGIIQYRSSNFKVASGAEFLNAKYLIDTTGKVFGKQITAQTLPPQ